MERQLIAGSRSAPKRPNFYADEIMRKVAKRLAGPISEWLEDNGPSGIVLEDRLHLMLDEASSFEGYKLAQFLRDRWDWAGIDAKLTEILDLTETYMYDAYGGAITEWIHANNIKPKFDVGKKLMIPSSLIARCQPQNHVVAICITSIDQTQAQYGIVCPGLSVPYESALDWEDLEAYFSEIS